MSVKLDRLSREDKIALIALLEEKRRRKKYAKDVYIPNAGQREVHSNTDVLRCVFSGNGMGKTVIGVHEAVWAALGYNPLSGQHTQSPARVIVVLDSPLKVDQIWLPTIDKWFDRTDWVTKKNGKPYINEIVFPNGSTIRMMFHDQEPMVFESFEADFFVFDEPPPRRVYISCRRAGRTKGRKARYIIIGTPLAAPWLRTKIYEPWSRGESEDTTCFKYNTRVNIANLDAEEVDRFEKSLSEKERAIRFEGEFFDLEGNALSHLFKRDSHILDEAETPWNDDWPVCIAIDPHPHKEHVALALGCDEWNRLYAIRELSAKATPRVFAQQLLAWSKGLRVIDWVCDSMGSADMTGGDGFKSFIQILNEEGIQVRPTTWKEKSDEDFISRIQDILKVPDEPDNFGAVVPQFRSYEGCRGLIMNIEQVQWERNRLQETYKPKLDITQMDYLAALKYALATNLSYKKLNLKPFYFCKKAYGFQPRPKVVNKDHVKLRVSRDMRYNNKNRI